MDETLIRLDPNVSVMLGDDGLVLRDHLHRRELAAPDMVLLSQVLAISARPAPRKAWLDTITARLGIDRDAAAGMLDALLAERVLAEDAQEPARNRWAATGWGPAHDYHWHTRALPKPDWSTRAGLDEDVAAMREYVQVEDPPDSYLDRGGDYRIALPPWRGALPARAVSDTVTTGDPGPLGFDELTALLGLCFGQRGARRLPVTGVHVTKSSPSGGSRHPTEAYLLAMDVDGLVAGTYHYSVRDHALDRIDDRHPGEFVARDVVMLRGRLGFRPRAVVLLTSLVERSMFRYRESRSYRVLYLDAGHLLQTFAHAAAAAGRPSYRGYAVRPSAAARWLRVNPLEQIPIAFGALG